LDLYGMSFGEALDPGAAALAAKIVAGVEESSSLGGSDEGKEAAARVARLRAAAAVLRRKEEAKRLRQQIEEQMQLISEAKQLYAKQQDKLRQADKLLNTDTQSLSATSAKIEHEEKEHKSLTLKIDLARQRDAAHEYWDRIKGDEAAAQKYLTTMVTFAASPARILTEVFRLKAHVRDNFFRHKKETAAASRRLSDGRRQLAELESEQDRDQKASKRPRLAA